MVNNREDSVEIEMIPVHGINVSGYTVDSTEVCRPPPGQTRLDLDLEAGHSLNEHFEDHKDRHGRYFSVKNEHEKCLDHYLRPEDGRLSLLRVQRVESNISYSGIQPPWARPEKLSRNKRLWQSLQNAAPKLLVWTYEEWLNEETARTNPDNTQNYRHKSWKTMYWKYPMASIGLTATVLFGSFGGRGSYNGQYPMIRYRYFGYPKVTRNEYEGLDHAVKDPGQSNGKISTRPIESSNPTKSETKAESSNNGKPLVTKLRLDQKIRHKAIDRRDTFDGALGRHLRPKLLCLVPGDDDEETTEPGTYQVVDVDQWDERNKGSDSLQYVFVSYTRDQFQTYTEKEIESWEPRTDQELRQDENNRRKWDENDRRGHEAETKITGKPFPTDEQLREQDVYRNQRMGEMHAADLQRLYEIGIKAAEDAKVKAFWIDVLCLEPSEPGNPLEMDAYRICDVARGAKSLVIALKDRIDDSIKNNPAPSLKNNPAPSLKNNPAPSTDTLLVNWAARLWTLPEMLLAPTQHDLAVWRYTRNGPRRLETIAKRNMAERACRLDGEDPHLVRQLVDHFESNLHLSQTELLTIGLACLVKRRTLSRTDGDPVYALMTLARRRPKPIKEDSLFVAFAKLSCMNDSDELLERLICMMPPARGQPWHKMEDYWKVKLSDIKPICQVAGITYDQVDRIRVNQSVILDGAKGASIIWHKIPRVAFLKRPTLWRTATKLIIQMTPSWLIIGIVTLSQYAKPVSTPVYTNNGFSSHSSVSPFVAVGIVFFLLGVSLVIVLPRALLSMYQGKFWATEAWFIGIEGPVSNLNALERKMFGFSEGRLKWSAFNSTLSQHRPRTKHPRLKEDECEGIPPSAVELPLDNNVVVREHGREGRTNTRAGVTEATTEVEPDRIFTLVDTHTMTVTTFRAVHPPSVLMVCGSEGGAQRALLCSYNYRTQTFHRETVLRMETEILDRMEHVPRFRFSMESQRLAPNASPNNSITGGG